MVEGESEHRLSHRFRHELLQRALPSRPRNGRGPLGDHDRRDLPQEPARGFAPARARTRESDYAGRTPAKESSGAPRMDTFAHGELGGDDRSEYSSPVRTDSFRQAASGNGLP